MAELAGLMREFSAEAGLKAGRSGQRPAWSRSPATPLHGHRGARCREGAAALRSNMTGAARRECHAADPERRPVHPTWTMQTRRG